MPWLPQSKVSPVSPLAAMSDVQFVTPQVDTSKVTGPLASYESFLRARQQGIQMRAQQRNEQRDIAKLGEEQAEAERTAALRDATMRVMPSGATSFDIASIEEHQKRFGTLPMDPATGRVDLPKVRDNLERQMQIEQALQAYKTFGGTGGLPDSAAAAAAAGDLVKPDKRLEIEQQQNRLLADKDEIRRALAIIQDSSTNTVGPLAGRTVGRVWTWLKTFAGKPEAYENQRALEMTMSANILAKAENMKGQLSDRDVRFLKSSVPTLSDTEQTWLQFIRNWDAIVDRQYQKNAMALAGTLSSAQRDAPVCEELGLARPGDSLVPKTPEQIVGDAVNTATLPADRKPGEFYHTTDAAGKPVVVKIDDNGVAVPLQPGQPTGVPSFSSPAAASANSVSPLPANTESGAASVLKNIGNSLSANFVKAAMPHPWKTMKDRLMGSGGVSPAPSWMQKP